MSGPHDHFHFSFVGREITGFLEFIAGIRTVDFPNAEKMHLTDDRVREIALNKEQASRVFADHEQLFVEIAEKADLAKDLIAVGYRRKELERFNALLNDTAFFRSELATHERSPEALWQSFFEANQWIFGYGLSFQFLSGLDRGRLEQIVSGHSVHRFGKRADALLKSRGFLSSLCFAEIKRHDTPLLEASPYRAGAWAPSRELVGGVAQVQATVQDAIELYSRKLEPIHTDGSPTGEILFNVAPRAFLVAGRLSEFVASEGINEAKFRSFELYRRSTQRPEIITFDELLERARFIVEQAS